MATLEQVRAEAQQNGRVFPQPQKWQQLYDMLPNKRCIAQMVRFRELIEWASTTRSTRTLAGGVRAVRSRPLSLGR